MALRKLLLAAALVLSVMASGCQSPLGCCGFSKCRPNYASYYPRAYPAPAPCCSTPMYSGWDSCYPPPCGDCGGGYGMGEDRGCGPGHRGLVPEPQPEYGPRNAGEKRDVYYTPAEE